MQKRRRDINREKNWFDVLILLCTYSCTIFYNIQCVKTNHRTNCRRRLNRSYWSTHCVARVYFNNNITGLAIQSKTLTDKLQRTRPPMRRGIRSRPYGFYRFVYILSRRECLDGADDGQRTTWYIWLRSW